MGKNKQYKKIRKIARELPVVTNLTMEKHYVLGEELLKNGADTSLRGEKIEADTVYVDHMPVIMPVNHTRGMKKAFRQHGVDGVFAYIDAVETRCAEDGQQNSKQ